MGAEIGPRMVLNPIKVFHGAFSGYTPWENASYITPCAKRSVIKRMKAGNYQQKLADKAAYEASRPTEPTYKVDETEEVFKTIAVEDKENDDLNTSIVKKKKVNRKPKKKAK